VTTEVGKADRRATGRSQHADLFHATGLLVVRLAGREIAAMTRFDNSVVDRFGLPRTLAT
jgi:hypothetical protein